LKITLPSGGIFLLHQWTQSISSLINYDIIALTKDSSVVVLEGSCLGKVWIHVL